MSKIIVIDEVRYYESKNGLMCFVIDTEGESWKIMIEDEMEDFFPYDTLDVSNWEFQNGNV